MGQNAYMHKITLTQIQNSQSRSEKSVELEPSELHWISWAQKQTLADSLHLLWLTFSTCLLWQTAAARLPLLQWPCQWSTFGQLARLLSFPVQLNFQKASVKVATSPVFSSALLIGNPWTKPSSLHKTVASSSSQPLSHTCDHPLVPLISTAPTFFWSEA